MHSLILTLLAIWTIDAAADTWSPYSDGREGGCWLGSTGKLRDCTVQPPPSLRDSVRIERTATPASSDLIFNDGFDGQNENGGTSCATATVLAAGLTYTADTIAAPNWMSSFGPLNSPSNDVVYTFVAGPDVSGFITPIASNFDFAMYLIPSCESGTEPSPIGATATIGRGIDLATSGVTSGNTYYLAITGTASGGGGANGRLNFTTPFSIGATVQGLKADPKDRRQRHR